MEAKDRKAARRLQEQEEELAKQEAAAGHSASQFGGSSSSGLQQAPPIIMTSKHSMRMRSTLVLLASICNYIFVNKLSYRIQTSVVYFPIYVTVAFNLSLN